MIWNLARDAAFQGSLLPLFYIPITEKASTILIPMLLMNTGKCLFIISDKCYFTACKDALHPVSLVHGRMVFLCYQASLLSSRHSWLRSMPHQLIKKRQWSVISFCNKWKSSQSLTGSVFNAVIFFISPVCKSFMQPLLLILLSVQHSCRPNSALWACVLSTFADLFRILATFTPW